MLGSGPRPFRLGSDWVQIGAKAVQIEFRLGSDWVQIWLGSGLRRLGSDWVQIGFSLGSDWVQIGFRLGSDLARLGAKPLGFWVQIGFRLGSGTFPGQTRGLESRNSQVPGDLRVATGSPLSGPRGLDSSSPGRRSPAQTIGKHRETCEIDRISRTRGF